MPDLNHDQFHAWATQHLGPDSMEGNDVHGEVFDKVPEHVYRVMSDEEYQLSTKRGFFQSDERNNWKAQYKQERRPQAEIDAAPQEGTVGGRWAELGYLPERAPGRIVKFDAARHPGWEVHPHVEEGDYIRSLSPIPADTVKAVSPPISRRRSSAGIEVTLHDEGHQAPPVRQPPKQPPVRGAALHQLMSQMEREKDYTPEMKEYADRRARYRARTGARRLT